MGKQPKIAWSQVKTEIKQWDVARLTGLVQDSFEHSQDNRDFLAARLLRDAIGPQVLAPYVKRIKAAYYDKSGDMARRLNHKDARSAIREYHRATGDLAGALELLIVHVEVGTKFTHEFGDVDEPFYDSLETSLYEAKKLLLSEEGRALYPRVKDRLAALLPKVENIGWGYGDSVRDVEDELQHKLGGSAT